MHIFTNISPHNLLLYMNAVVSTTNGTYLGPSKYFQVVYSDVETTMSDFISLTLEAK